MITDITPAVFHVGKTKAEHKDVAHQGDMFEVPHSRKRSGDHILAVPSS